MDATIDVSEPIDDLKAAAHWAGVEVAEYCLPEDTFIQLNDLRFHYLDWAQPGARTIVFLHGSRLTAHTFDLVCLSLRERFHCISVDARGHGDTAWAPDGNYSHEARVSDVEALVAELGLRDFVLVGMSMGGGTAIGYAGRHSADLRGLVLVDTGAGREDPTSRPGAQRLHDFNNGPVVFETLEDAVERAIAFNPARDRRLLRRSLLNSLRQEADGTWRWKYDRDGFARRGPQEGPMRAAELRESLGHIACPTLVLRGGRSDMFTDGDAESTVSLLADGRWARVEDAGHTIQGDNPRGMLVAVEPFLAEIEA